LKINFKQLYKLYLLEKIFSPMEEIIDSSTISFKEFKRKYNKSNNN